MKPSSFNTLLVISAALAALIGLPVLSVLTNIFSGGTGATWQHLLATVLPEYVGNTLWLCLGVGIGVVVVGVTTAWLTTMHDFPGRRLFAWALVLPLAVPAYVLAYVYTDFLQFVGPLQSGLRETFGWSRADYWFPDVRSLGGAVTMFIFVFYPYVYLLARTAFIERASGMLEAARTLGHRAVAQLLPGIAAAGATGGGGRCRAGADGDARRLRHGVLLRRADLHHRHLPGVVLTRRPDCSGATGGLAARFCHRAAAGRAAFARQGEVSQYHRAQSAARSAMC